MSRFYFILILIFGIPISKIYSTPKSYVIELKSDIKPGWNAQRQILRIPVLKKGSYSERSFYIKTKNYESLDKESTSFFNPDLQKYISSLNIESITHPFGTRKDVQLSSSQPGGLDRIYLVTVKDSVEPYEICSSLMESPDVEYAVPVFFHELESYTPNDVHYNEQYALKMIDAADAWDIVRADSTIIIGIIDSGVDIGHYDLLGSVYKNPGEIPGDGKDNDNNGYIDDVYGWDFVGNIKPDAAAKGNFIPDNNVIPFFSNNTHGTHVAGLAAAVTDNAIGIASAGFHASFLPVKTTIDDLSAATGSREIYAGFAGIKYAVDMGAKIINLSWVGQPYNPVERDIITYAWFKGALILAAAGNDKLNTDLSPDFPTGYPGVVAVGAHDDQGNKSSFSRYGYGVDFYAPGTAVYSTLPSNQYDTMSGTSMAAPIASSVAALLMIEHPNWTQEQIRHQIRSTCVPMTADSINHPLYYGRINAYHAVKYNNPAYPNSVVPGLGISAIQFWNSDAITNYMPTDIRLTIHNYLATAKNTTVEITSEEIYYNLKQSEFFVPEIPGNSDYQITLSLKLNRYNPWFVGYLPLKLKFSTMDGYVDYQYLNIPISISSKNEFSVQFHEPDTVSYWYRQCSSEGFNDFKAVGLNFINSGKSSFFDLSASSKYSLFLDADMKAVAALSDNVMTGSSDGKIYRKSTGGNFAESIIYSITPEVRALHYFSSTTVCMIGTHADEHLAIANSDNGGASWKLLSDKVNCAEDEDIYYNSHSFSDKRGMFGTNRGRIISTSDSGKTWDSYSLAPNGAVRQTALLQSGGAVAAYYETYTSGLTLAYSKDGIGWTKTGIDLTELNIDPSSIVPDKFYDLVYFITNTGRIYRYNPAQAKITAVLTSEFYGETITTGNLYQNTTKSRAWLAGDNVYTLDFQAANPKDTAILKSLENSPYDLGKISVDSTAYLTINFQNKGIAPIIIDSVKYNTDTNDSNIYSVVPVVPAILNSSDTMKINFSVKGVKIGPFTKNIAVWSDELQDSVSFEITGTIVDKVGIVEDTGSGLESIYPNPADRSVTLKTGRNARSVRISDISGRTIIEKKADDFNNEETVLNTSSLSQGVYLVEIIYSDGKSSVQKLIIAH